MSYQDKLKALKAKQQTTETVKPTIIKDTNMSTEQEHINDDDDDDDNDDIEQEENTPKNEIVDIIGKEALERMAQAGIIPVPSAQVNELVESHNKMTAVISQINQQLELAKNKIAAQSEKLKNQRGLIRKFYQLEAATIGAKEALEAMLRCFDNTGQGLQGWPTMQVFTPDGWVKGSVDYNLHNAVLLAKTATTSENLQVIEKHVRGFTDKIKVLQSDISDLQQLVPFKLENCGYCRKYKKVNAKCWNCGKDKSDEMGLLDEDDDDDD